MEMNDTRMCCQNLAENVTFPTPFSRMIVLGFYDGPTSGLVQCGSCSASYYFDMLDWDEDHEVRIFRLAALRERSFQNCVQIYEAFEEPRWPIWWPFSKTSPPEAMRPEFERQLANVLVEAKPPEWLVAWQGYGEEILAAKKVSSRLIANERDWFSQDDGKPTEDWFSLLGLDKVRA
jgi:hypothetical protein